MAYTYNELVSGFRWKRAEILNAALHTKSSHTVQGASSMFANALFCILEREFSRSPNKKRAILIWEMFLDSNFEKHMDQHNKIFLPQQAIWPTALEMNVEGSGGVKEADFMNIQNGMSTVLAVYDNGQALTKKNRKKTSHTRKFNILGNRVTGDMFKPVVNKIKSTIPLIGSTGTESVITGLVAKSIYKNRQAIEAVINKAGFNAAGTGLQKLVV